MVGEQHLSGPGAGGGTIRIGDTTRRTEERAPEAMRLVLQHLETVGFDGAPRLCGQDEFGRWILTYIPGEVALPPYAGWVACHKTLASVAKLLRRYHDAVASLGVPRNIKWPTIPPSGFEGNLLGHMDVSMANVVCRNGIAIALIDFEEVGPVTPLWDVVRTARYWVPLLDPVDLTGSLDRLDGNATLRLALFADTYGLEDHDRVRLVDAALLNADISYERMRQRAAAGHVGGLAEWAGVAALRNRRTRAWIAAHRTELDRALGV
ncbi:MAG TPA: hypothetical protein DEV93_14745 [Chloroflexi bacterium]|nr:hypothetical protein [Chloroflexota bacterium]